MGFPVGYTKLFMPKILIHTLSFLGFLHSVVVSLFTILGLSDYIDNTAENIWHDYSSPQTRMPIHHHHHAKNPPPSAALIRKILPVVKFEDISAGEVRPESCMVCLHNFEGDDEIRWLESCHHVFHRACLDRWMDKEQTTCPLCRTPFVPEDRMREELDRRLWTGAGDICG